MAECKGQRSPYRCPFFHRTATTYDVVLEGPIEACLQVFWQRSEVSLQSMIPKVLTGCNGQVLKGTVDVVATVLVICAPTLAQMCP